MKTKAGFLLMVTILGCSSGELVPIMDLITSDSDAEAAPESFEILQDETVASDIEVGGTCLQSLLPWHCLPSEGRDCGGAEECYGQGTCGEPPCWGLCMEFPGQCLPAAKAVTCTKSSQCDEGYVCTGRVGGLPGYCKARPYATACWADEDCPNGQYCAGEVSCAGGGLCPGVEMFGKCKVRPSDGACYEDDDCPNGYCDGAVFCLGDCTSDQPGTCKDGPRPSCFDQSGCKDSPQGNLCTGAFRCPTGHTCALPDQGGFCMKFGGFGSCWEDEDCQKGYYCRSAAACRPGTLCNTAIAHPGSCAEAPPDGDGIVLSVTSAKAGKDFPLLVLNKGAVQIYIDPCVAALVSGKVPGTDKWPDDPFTMILAGPFPTPACKNEGNDPWLVVPPGSGFVTYINIQLTGYFKVVVPYKLGCRQGDRMAECGADYSAVSAPFEVK